MSARDRGTTARGQPISRQSPSFFGEAKQLLVIAGPLAAAYLAELAMLATMKTVIGELGYRQLASIGLASDVSNQVLVVLFGLMSVVGVLAAQAIGSRELHNVGRAVHQGIVVATLLALPAAVLVWNLDHILAFAGIDAELVVLMEPFLKPQAASLFPVLWFFVLRMFVASIAKTGAVMAITVAAVVVNYILCRGLILGEFGLPQLGVAGAGWAKLIVAVFQLGAIAAYAYLTPGMRGYGLFLGNKRIDRAMCAEILRLGLPVAGIVILEMSLFMFVTIGSGIIGPIAAATHQVLMVWISLAFKTAHGLAEAGMIRVARGIGEGSLTKARLSGLVTMAMGVAWLTVLSFVPLTFPKPLVLVFLNPADPGFAQVLDLTTKILVLAAFFQIFDGLQVMAALALRGLKDTVVPLWIATIGYWLFGIGCGWLLAFQLELGAAGLWWGMATGLTVTGSLLGLRFLRLTRGGRAN
ncbi:MAG: MATE family efflux transporter [Hyphomicrobiaceae bacterium]